MLNHNRIVNLTIFPPQKASIPCRRPQPIPGDVSVEFLSVVERTGCATAVDFVVFLKPCYNDILTDSSLQTSRAQIFIASTKQIECNALKN